MTKELCNEMAILNGGKILTQGTPKRLQMRWKPSTCVIEREALEETKRVNIISLFINQDTEYSRFRKPNESFVSQPTA
jgi:ABC-type multidrug transport system ATPase subunit